MSRNSDHSTSGELEVSARSVYIALPDAPPEGVDLAELWLTLWYGKWFIVAVTAIFAVASIFYSLSIEPVFRSEVILAPVTRNTASNLGGLGGLANLAGIRLDANTDSRHAEAVLESKDFLGKFILDNNLLPVLFKEEWDDANERWKTDDPALQRDVRDGIRVFRRSIFSLTEDPQSGLLTLAIEWSDPDTAADWAGKLVKRVNELIRSEDIAESERKLEYLNEQLNEASLVELRLAISRVIEEQISAMMLAQSQQEYAFDVIDPPMVPKERVRPKRTLIVIIGTLLGGFISALVLIGRLGAKRVAAKASARRTA